MNINELIHLWNNLHLFNFSKDQKDRLRKAALLNIYAEMQLNKLGCQRTVDEIYEKVSQPLTAPLTWSWADGNGYTINIGSGSTK